MKIIGEQLKFAKETIFEYLKRKKAKSGSLPKLGAKKKKMTKAEKTFILQCFLTVFALSLGGYLLIASRNDNYLYFAKYGTGLIGMAIGYWLR